MGFPHCPICVVLAFVSVFMGVTRSYMFFILVREFKRAESTFKLRYLHSEDLGSGLNPRGVLDFSPLYFFSKRKIALQGN